MSNVFSLQERRDLLALKRQLDELETQMAAMEHSTAAMKMRLDPQLAKKVADLVLAEHLLRYGNQWERLRAQFAVMFEMVFAAQKVAGQERDWESAAALIFIDSGFITELDKRVDARVENLPRDAARFRRELNTLCAQPAEPARPVLVVVPVEDEPK